MYIFYITVAACGFVNIKKFEVTYTYTEKSLNDCRELVRVEFNEPCKKEFVAGFLQSLPLDNEYAFGAWTYKHIRAHIEWVFETFPSLQTELLKQTNEIILKKTPHLLLFNEVANFVFCKGDKIICDNVASILLERLQDKSSNLPYYFTRVLLSYISTPHDLQAVYEYGCRSLGEAYEKEILAIMSKVNNALYSSRESRRLDEEEFRRRIRECKDQEFIESISPKGVNPQTSEVLEVEGETSSHAVDFKPFNPQANGPFKIVLDKFLHLRITDNLIGEKVDQGESLGNEIGYCAFIPDNPKAILFYVYGGAWADDKDEAKDKDAIESWGYSSRFAKNGVAVVTLRLADELHQDEKYRGFGVEQSRQTKEDKETLLKQITFACQNIYKIDPKLKDLKKVVMGRSYGGFIAELMSAMPPYNTVFDGYIPIVAVAHWLPKGQRPLLEETSKLDDWSAPIELVKNIQKPVLLIHGLRDDNVSVQHSIDFYEAAQKAGTDSKIQVYIPKKSGHFDAEGKGILVAEKIYRFIFSQSIKPEITQYQIDRAKRIGIWQTNMKDYLLANALHQYFAYNKSHDKKLKADDIDLKVYNSMLVRLAASEFLKRYATWFYVGVQIEVRLKV